MGTGTCDGDSVVGRFSFSLLSLFVSIYPILISDKGETFESVQCAEKVEVMTVLSP